ncbi:cyclic pyranopterin monophosphate synthase subunit MoaA [Gottschalkia purinilytica]|uniref:GTP 3',8-cyclase n=1 Tax=Gottschalkia purinilytica TaxID=1503 RepID=A0A0L0W6T8_GOTPU|nr:GTP 3',8-cyclase MoaA [Gottschalkia purinilytica]KNF07268.1 cyclic pyranopterin monophosphate synthase subunit MoaA [Gottschalkia purinilytica]
MKDSFERDINYLRISITDLCNLRCKYCMPEDGINKINHENVLTFEEIYEISKNLVSLGITKIRITGGEPLVRNGIVELVRKISSLDKVKDLSMTTNGILLKKYAKDLKEAGLDRVNISLDTLNEEKYKDITRTGNLKDVLDGIEEAKKVGLNPIKINVVLIDGFNINEIEDFVYITQAEKIDVRFIELMPIGEGLNWNKNSYLSGNIVLEKVKELVKVESEDISSPATYYKLPNGKGRVGIISPMSCKFCSNCNRLRLTSQGKLKLCLHSDEEIDLRKSLRDGEDLKKVIREAILKKPEEHQLEKGVYTNKSMFQIGG